MSFKSFVGKSLATWVVRSQQGQLKNPALTQQKIFKRLLQKAQRTIFGGQHNFKSIQTYKDFKECVPLRNYEAFSEYIQKIKDGVVDVLWPGRPIYFAKTSGTTGGDKYIPLTQDSIKHHIVSARDALLYYIYNTGKSDFLSKKMIFLSGSPQLIQEAGIPTGRLSGIVNHHIPGYIRIGQLPTHHTNCISDWETKLDKIVEETVHADMGLISGIPPWVQMYFDKLIQKTGKSISNIFPGLSLLVHGGVNFAPYHRKIFDSIGCEIDTIETYPASEGFIAFQNSQEDKGLLLQINHGMFFEFISTETLNNQMPTRLNIEEVQLGVDYAIALSSDAGLWGYMLGDTVKFVSLVPSKIIFTGRIKHYISAFGEHVIVEEIEKAMQQALAKYPLVRITEFTVAPWVSSQPSKASYHEWFIEFAYPPENIDAFSLELNQQLCQLNSYYKDLIEGHILNVLQITPLRTGAFIEYMRCIGKLGEQNKVVRVANNREVVDGLSRYKLDFF